MPKHTPKHHSSVRFSLPIGTITGKDEKHYAALLRRCFGVSPSFVPGFTQEIQITCRKDQFAEFLILRHHMGVSNQFAVLKPEFVDPPHHREPPPEPIVKLDVTDFDPSYA